MLRKWMLLGVILLLCGSLLSRTKNRTNNFLRNASSMFPAACVLTFLHVFQFFLGRHVTLGNMEVQYQHQPSYILQPATVPTKLCGLPGTGNLSQFFGQPAVPSRSGLKFPNLSDAMMVRNKSSTRLSLNPSVSQKIIGGFHALRNQLCWQVTLDILITNSQGIVQFSYCGGTIIGSRTILTAAHCVTDLNGEPVAEAAIMVNVGSMDNSIGLSASSFAEGCAQSYKVERVARHPHYDSIIINNDIALLTLTMPIDLENKPCACALCLKDKTPEPGETCIVSGVGREVDNVKPNRSSSPLKWLHVNVLRQSLNGTCSFGVNYDTKETTDLNLFICAGGVVGEDNCNGDSGGPLACLGNDRQSLFLAGVVSFGDVCANGVGSQYTKVQFYLDWIRSNSLANDFLVH